MTIIAPRLLVSDNTEYYDFGDDADKIVRIEDVHLFDNNVITHCCSFTGSHFCTHLYTCIEFADHVSDEDREALDDKYYYAGDMDWYVDAKSAENAIVLDDEAFEDYDYDEAFEEVHDYYRCNWHYG